jgi:hypothetical protein
MVEKAAIAIDPRDIAVPPKMVNGLFALVCTSSTLAKDHRRWRGTVVEQGEHRS